MKILTKLKKSFVQHFKIVTLWDIKAYISRSQAIKIGTALILNILNSGAKILAPAALAKAIEMYALGEKDTEIGPVIFYPRELLFFSLAFTAWVKLEIYIKKSLTKGLEAEIIEKNAMKIIKTVHEIPLYKHQELRPVITKSLIDVINLQSKLATEVVTVVSQVLFDIVLGTTLIWHRYGVLIGAEFLLYSALDVVLLTHLVDYFTTQSHHFNKMKDTLQKFINHEYEILNYEETVRLFNHEQLEVDLSAEKLTKYLTALKHQQFAENIASVIKLIPTLIANIIPISFIAKKNVSLSDLDDFVFLLSYINLFGSNLLSLNNSIKSCQRAVNSIETMEGWMSKALMQNLHTQKKDIISIENSMIIADFSPPEISFEDVYFTYPDRSEPTLKGLNFKIAPGCKVGIIGRTTAGKSTIFKLLFGLYRPQAGVIKINGENIEEIPKEILCKIFCSVPQNVDLFRERSLKNNVLYGLTNDSLLKKSQDEADKKTKQKVKDDLTSTEDYQAFKDLDLEIEQGKFSSTYQKTNRIFSKVMEKVQLQKLDNESADEKTSSLPLSGGQKQRVNIARALVRKSPVYLLDEPTGSLDAITESEVLNNIQEVMKDRTVLMITHRLSTIKDADQVIVLEKGEIVEQGSPEILLEKEGFYYNFWRSQM